MTLGSIPSNGGHGIGSMGVAEIETKRQCRCCFSTCPLFLGQGTSQVVCSPVAVETDESVSLHPVF